MKNIYTTDASHGFFLPLDIGPVQDTNTFVPPSDPKLPNRVAAREILRNILASSDAPEKLARDANTTVAGSPEVLDVSGNSLREYAADVRRKAYWDAVRAVIDDYRKALADGEVTDYSKDDWIRTRVNSDWYVFLEPYAKETLLYSDHADAYAGVYAGPHQYVRDGRIDWGALAYEALLADVREQLAANGFHAQNPDDVMDSIERVEQARQFAKFSPPEDE